MEYAHTIAVNARLLLKGKLEGMGRFSDEILKRITASMPDCHFIFFFDRPYDDSFIYGPNITPIVCSPPTRHVFLYYWWLQHSIRPILNKLKPDLFFSPDGLCILGSDIPQIPVIHDLNFEHHPEFHRFWARKYYRYFFPKFAKIAQHIFTVSEFSKNDIIQTYHVDGNKISVVYNGISQNFYPITEDEKISTRKKYTGGRPYFVYVGSLHPRKNIIGLLRSFSEFKKMKNSNLALVLAGPMYWGLKEIYHTLKSLSIENDVIFTHRLPDIELNKVVGSAAAMVYIPFFEGFGIPVIEAFASEVPVICSNVTSLPEVAGQAAFLVNPHKPDEVAMAMKYLLENEHETQEKIHLGREQLKKFSWDESAKVAVRILSNYIKKN